MDMQWFGANCIVMNNKQARVVIDDNLADLGAKSVTKEGDIVLFTADHASSAPHDPRLLLDQPGEYEVSGVSIYGIAARAHMDEEGKMSATMYKIVADDVTVLITGHVYPELSEDQLEAIGMVDVMFVPVGGNGYTLDGVGALKLIKKVEPKVVVPTHYDDPKLHFEVPQQSLDDALKALAMEPKEAITKLRFKTTELGESSMELVVLERA